MPSHLTRSVFRRLLANEPIIHRGCLRRRQHGTATLSTKLLQRTVLYNGQTLPSSQQRRSFFNFNIFSKKTHVREADMDPGIDKMMELAKRQRMKARMPSLEDVAEALRTYIQHKTKQKQVITDMQAQLVAQSLRHYLVLLQDMLKIEDRRTSRKAFETQIGVRWAEKALRVIALTDGPSAAHLELLDTIYTLAEHFGESAQRDRLLKQIIPIYAKALSFCKGPADARNFVRRCESMNDDPNTPRSNLIEEAATDAGDEVVFEASYLEAAWGRVLHGFVRQNDHDGVRNTLDDIGRRDYGNSALVVEAMIRYSLTNNDLQAVVKWWQQLRHNTNASNSNIPARHFKEILLWCLENNALDTGREMIKHAMANNPPKAIWDVIFVWAAGTTKSVDEINRMMDVMEQSNIAIADPSERRLPDNATINALVELAVSRQDPYMAERFITLGRQRNIEPDGRTYALQIQYRLSVNDVDGALVAYKALAEQKETESAEASSADEAAIINQLIIALCRTQRHDFDTIMNVTMDLADRRAAFLPATVGELAVLHLNRDESDDALDLLNTHAYHFGSEGRQHLREVLFSYATASTTPTPRAWRAYNILYSVFDEIPRDKRTELMVSFFERDRADIGVRIFQHMRHHSRADTIPDVDTYVGCFLSLAKLRDIDSLEVVYNLLKLDYNINVNTYLRNALIIAYTACGKGRKALGFWNDIVASQEGPSYNSIHCALRACEKSPFGDLRAQELWQLLRRRNIELEQPLWASYVAALAGNGDNDTALRTVEEAEAKGELEVDSFLLASLCDAAVGDLRQQEIEAWAKEKYPAAWKKMEEIGWEVDEARMKRFKIDRRVAP